MLFGKRERRISRILIVEDEPLVAFDNEYMLQDAGYEVVATVDSYADAAAAIESEAIDLVLTDISLAGEGDGIDVARAAAAKGVAGAVRHRPLQRGGEEPCAWLPRQALFGARAAGRARRRSTAISRAKSRNGCPSS